MFQLSDRRTALIYEGKLFHILNVGQLNGIPNNGNVGRETICLKEGLSHALKVGQLDNLGDGGDDICICKTSDTP